MAFNSPSDLKLLLVTVVCVIAAWGPIFAAIAIGIASGLGSQKTESARRRAKSRA